MPPLHNCITVSQIEKWPDLSCHSEMPIAFLSCHPSVLAILSQIGFRDTALLVTYSSIGYPDDRDRVVGNEQQTDQLCIALVRLISAISLFVAYQLVGFHSHQLISYEQSDQRWT